MINVGCYAEREIGCLVGGVIRTDNRIKHITKVYQITENETIASLAKHPNINNLTGGIIHQ